MRKKIPPYLSPLDIPEGVSGDARVAHVHHDRERVFDTANLRCAYFGSQKNQKIVYPHATRWHELSEGGAVWTTDYPQEQAQQIACLKGMKGRVLVGGLGLGLCLHLLAPKKAVREITVVEISQDVIDLVWGHLGLEEDRTKGRLRVVCQDLFEFLESYRGEPEPSFDNAFYDVWRSDGEGTFFDTVLPLLKFSQGVVAHRPRCWNEDVMRGQLFQASLIRKMFVTSPDMKPAGVPPPWEKATGRCARFLNWSVPLFEWVRDNEPTDEAFQEAAAFYARLYGTPAFKDSVPWKEAWQSFSRAILDQPINS